MENIFFYHSCASCKICFIFLLYLLPIRSQDTPVVYSVSSEEVQWDSLMLTEYNGFTTASLFSFVVPVSTKDLTLTLQSFSTPSNCPIKEVHVYFQHGSFPVISPYNESFPDKFYVERSELQHVTLDTSNKSSHVSVDNPIPDSWYLAAFFPKTEKKIEPKGFVKQCKYELSLQIISVIQENVEEIIIEEETQINISFPERVKTLRYIPLEGTYSYTVIIDGCYISQGQNIKNSSSCPISIDISMDTVPRLQHKDTVSNDCENSSLPCQTYIATPVVLLWNYMRINVKDNLLNFTQVRLNIKFRINRCKISYIHSPTIDTDTTKSPDISSSNMLQLSNESCEFMVSLGRLSPAIKDFSTAFYFPASGNNHPIFNAQLIVPSDTVALTYFIVNTQTDSGGTLKIQIQMLKHVQENTQDRKVWLCMMKNRIPSIKTVITCNGGVRLMVSTSSNDTYTDKIYIPYPEGGRWYIGLHSTCGYENTTQNKTCKERSAIKMMVQLSKCVEDGCGRYGECHEYISRDLIFSACKCCAGWRGYGCTDGKEAVPESALLVAVLLLTLSNLFFIPGIIVALRRRYFLEAFVYTYNMFFSTFYHACDTNKCVYVYCLTKYGVLSFCDLFGSIASFWVTILALARINDQLRSFLHIIGAVGIAVGVEYNQHYTHGVWAFVVPTVIGITIMLISWVRECYLKKGCYPPKKRCLIFLLPGVLLSGIGLIIFAFLETEDNYKYTHSSWHVVISLSIAFLLQVQPTKFTGNHSVMIDSEKESVRMVQNDATHSEDDDGDYLEPLIVMDSSRNLVL